MIEITETPIHRDVAAARAGTHPRLLARVPSGWLIFGERQFIEGYLLLLPDPVAPSLNELHGDARTQFLADMARAGDALLQVTAAVRINYAIFGNQDPALHAHIVPRFAGEPQNLRTQHPWAYDWTQAPAFDPLRQRNLIESLRRLLVAE